MLKENYDRCFEELEEFKKRDMLPMLQFLVYMVDQLKHNNILCHSNCDDSKLNVLYACGYALSNWKPRYDSHCFFAIKDEVNWNPEIIDFDTIKETAFVIPDLESDIIDSIDNNEEPCKVLVIPPRDTWESIGWEDKIWSNCY